MIIAIANQKGGVGKTTVAANLGFGLAQKGYSVLLIDADSQGSLTGSLGIEEPDDLEETLYSAIHASMEEKEYDLSKLILHHSEGLDFIPANIELASLEIDLLSYHGREYFLSEVLEPVRDRYDYILIDCMPFLGSVTTNVLVCADTVLIPVKASRKSTKGLMQLYASIQKIRKRLNRKLSICGIVVNLYRANTNYQRSILETLRSEEFSLPVFDTVIPDAIKADESGAEGQSLFSYAPKAKVTDAFRALTEEVIQRVG